MALDLKVLYETWVIIKIVFSGLFSCYLLLKITQAVLNWENSNCFIYRGTKYVDIGAMHT